MYIVPSNCFCCGSNDFTDFFVTKSINDYRLKICRTCSVVIAQSSTELRFFDYVDYGDYLIVNPEEIEAMVKIAATSHCNMLSDIKERMGTKAKILDFGCGAGYFVKVANDFGFDAVGCEASKKLRTFSNQVFNQKNYELMDDINDQFDVITAFDVIEHLHPLENRSILTKLLSMLKPGGFFMGNTPNINSLNVLILKDREPVIAPPSHICYFSVDSLDRYLTSLGLLRDLIFTKGFVMGSFFRREKFEPSFLEKPCPEMVKKWALQKPLIVVQKVVDKALNGTDKGYQVHFKYRKPLSQ